MYKGLSKFFDFSYFIKLLSLFLLLYVFNLFFIGITAPGGKFYSVFLDNHLNYIVWLRNGILYTSKLFAHCFGLHPYVADLYTLQENVYSVTLVYSCLGLGIISFWIAFIVAGKNKLPNKLLWIALGVATIWMINSLRISVLLLASEKNWSVNKYINHHDLFNFFSYILLLLLMYIYYRSSKKNKIIKSNIYLREANDINIPEADLYR